jgi:restriction system protein
MRPLLAFSSDGSEKDIKDAIIQLAKQFELSEDELNQLLPSGKQTIFANRVHWARTYLDKAGAFKRTRRSHFAITERGQKILAEHPDRIDNSVLRQFPEFVEFQTPRISFGEKPVPPESATLNESDTAATPEESIQQAELQILMHLKSDLLESIGNLSPAFFESLVVDLIVAMGYGGGSRTNVAQRIGMSGDGGIDGIVNEDPLGLDVVYLQAKRYGKDNTIGREKIQQFVGALIERSSTKGVFVTTSSFTKGAIEYATKVPQKVVLIGGEQLADFMIQFGVGVRTERTINIKKIDTDYFEETDD